MCVCVCVRACMRVRVCVCVLFGFVKKREEEERGEREGARVGRILSASSANGQPSIHVYRLVRLQPRCTHP